MFYYLQLFWYYPAFLAGIYIGTLAYQRLYQLNPMKRISSVIQIVYKNIFFKK
jgi:hypothetical protein